MDVRYINIPPTVYEYARVAVYGMVASGMTPMRIVEHSDFAPSARVLVNKIS